MPKDSTPQLTRFNETKARVPACPGCDSNMAVVKDGQRKNKQRTVQRYKCQSCARSFSTEPIPRTSYPPKIIAFALSYFNIGHTLEETRTKLKRSLKTSVPVPTIL